MIPRDAVGHGSRPGRADRSITGRETDSMGLYLLREKVATAVQTRDAGVLCGSDHISLNNHCSKYDHDTDTWPLLYTVINNLILAAWTGVERNVHIKQLSAGSLLA